MDRYATLVEEQQDLLAGVHEQLGMDSGGAHSDLEFEVCLELLAHVTRRGKWSKKSIQ